MNKTAINCDPSLDSFPFTPKGRLVSVLSLICQSIVSYGNPKNIFVILDTFRRYSKSEVNYDPSDPVLTIAVFVPINSNTLPFTDCPKVEFS